MKILHLSNTADRSGGGVSEVVHALLYYQHSLGYSSTLWYLGKKSQINEKKNDNKIDINRLTLIPLILGFRFLISPHFFLKLKRVNKKNDIIHQHGLFLPISLLTLTLNKKSKVIIQPHGYLEPEKLKVSSFKKKIALLLFEKKNLNKCCCLVACSKQEAISLRDFGLSQPIVILPNGVSDSIIRKNIFKKKDLSFKTKHSINKDTKILLFLSRIHPFKGLRLLLKSILIIKDEFRKNDWIFIVAGNNELNHQKELVTFVEENDIRDIVRFIGPQYNDNKINAFDSADCFILPSKGENFGIVIIEALARGVPVITTKNTPWSELISSDCGWWIERTQKDFIEILLKMLNKDKNYLMKMGKNGVNLVREKYTWSNIAQQSIKMYKWILNDFNEKYKNGFTLLNRSD